MNSFQAETASLLQCIDQFPNVRVLCVGDIMLDQFVYGDVSRISPEGPVPVIQVIKEEAMLGGAGNVVRNLCALGVNVTFASVLGDDPEGAAVEQRLRELPACEAIILREADRRTSIKRRYVARGQHLMRADSESVFPLKADTLEQLSAAFAKAIDECNVVVLSDYGKGVLLGSVATVLIDLANRGGKPVIVDPKGLRYERYQNCSLIKPNLRELGEATAMPVDTNAGRVEAAKFLLERIEAEVVLVTMGAKGSLLVEREAVTFFPSKPREVFDVSGAGDTVAATLAAALATGASLQDSAHLANLAAGLVVTKSGTAVVEPSDLRREVETP